MQQLLWSRNSLNYCLQSIRLRHLSRIRYELELLHLLWNQANI
ncbi:unnamed protein product [Arabidopsis halleri]